MLVMLSISDVSYPHLMHRGKKKDKSGKVDVAVNVELGFKNSAVPHQHLQQKDFV